MPGTISWFEVRGRDASKLRSFYQDLFDWSFQLDAPPEDYGVVDPTQAKLPGGTAGKIPSPEDKNAGGSCMDNHNQNYSRANEKSKNAGV